MQNKLKYIKILLTFFVLLTILQPMQAQVSVSVYLNRKSVYVQQPFRVTITVYTKTWFTQPLEFNKLQIPNAFIIPFDKTQPGMFTIGGKQYPGIQFYYIVFPYEVGNFTVPPIEITAQSPPEGSSESRKVVLHTTPQSFEVKDVPDDLKKKGTWFVAKNVNLQDSWEPSSANYKVGDVVKRTITINAGGTLPQFIPELSGQEKLSWASSYPRDPELTDTHAGGDANGRSVQTITYLIEKDGDFTVPAISLPYWNPYSAKMLTVSTKPVKIHVDKNNNLGILTTLKDSLAATQPTQSAGTSGKKPLLILGMHWYVFAGWALAAVILLYFAFRLGKRAYRQIRTKWNNYRISEKHLFRKFLRSGNEPQQFIPALYDWWDSLSGKPSASVGSSLEIAGKTNDSNTIKNYFDKTVKGEKNGGSGEIRKLLTDYRSQYNEELSNDDDNYPII
ncbi:MAG: BatD family protein [Tannerella sp.]|jgi:hypothetical protein|nr:BatD family protein [Tannerella sp.]